ncbi:Asp-tRNA(Asn)/Glu-tRNA(Gln) amidotransferase subunit GatC [Culicoidibacter larvae]|uniref:Aspartyl/glutamyl-tRNA(Asn/Gln) amidotransferase subunit C n=1 Tax=Culicoidibacter larvae TaxID=2579976 RepID=A0A5R8QFV5_9FIRM|nr:Asp-tRNA(Asn)/Glu-tRNA(Gln) amidotransferase subunit GatC [Culicoidibacter larvae]TLG75353.1 Asp-tRNA(Asn)/Glu-tRNA(Gln) amidotransferase subunit GatC [Culicoidibacter larvae]
MLKLTRDDILKLGKLSKIEITEDEIADVESKINTVLAMIEDIQHLDLSDVEPMFHPNPEPFIYRDEALEFKQDTAALLNNAPESENNQVKVPTVLKEEII